MANAGGAWRLERREWLLGVLVLALLAYGNHCYAMYTGIGRLRVEVAERVGWSTEIGAIQGELAANGVPSALAGRIEALEAEVGTQQAVRGGGALLLSLARSRSALQTGDRIGAGRELAEALGGVLAGTSALSRELGDLVDESAQAGAFGLVFGLASLAALAAALAALRANAHLTGRAELIARAVSAGAWDWEPATGRAQFSKGWEELTGSPASSVSDWYARVHPADLPALDAAIKNHLSGGTRTFEAEYRLRDATGRWRVMSARGLAERENGRAVRMAVAQNDITARRTQAAQEARSALLAHVSNATGMGFLAVDPGGTVHQANPAAARVSEPWGTPAAFWDALRPGLHPQNGTCALCGRPEPVGSETTSLATPANEPRFIQVTWTGHAHGLEGESDLSVAIVDDVTARRTALEAERLAHARLVVSEAELRAALDALPSALVVVAGGRIAFSNRTATDTFGADPNRHAALLSSAPEARGELRTVLLDTNAGLRSFEVFAPEPISFGGSQAELVLARDANDRVRVESQLRNAERLVALGGLAAGLAHEINNPLTYVIANLELAHEGVGNTADRIARALGGAVRLRQVVAQLREFASPAPVATEPLDPSDAFESAVALARGVGMPLARVSRSMAPGVLVEGVPVWLAQIALNLVNNALQAMVDQPAEDRRLDIRCEADDSTVTLRVCDTGCGVAEGLAATIFEPFVSTRSQSDGQGLGLYICRELATRMGGQLTLEHTSPEGSTFALTLRRAHRGMVRAPPDRASTPVRPRGRVLVVEDDAVVAERMRSYLSHHSVRVETTAEAGRLALLEVWDVVILDVVLGENSGITLWQELNARDAPAAARVVFVTGGSLTPPLAHFMLESSNPCLVKPFDFRDLVRLVDARVPGGAYRG